MEPKDTIPDTQKKSFCARCFLPIDADDKVDIQGQNFHRICSMCCICRAVPKSLKTFYGHVFCTNCFKTHVLHRFRAEQKSQSTYWSPGDKKAFTMNEGAEDGGKTAEAPVGTKGQNEEDSPKKQICSRCLQMVTRDQQKLFIGGQTFHQLCARCYCCQAVPKDPVKIYYGQVFCEDCFNRFIISKEKDNPIEFYKSCLESWNNSPAFGEQMRNFMASGQQSAAPLIFMMQGQQPQFCHCGGAEPQPNEAKKCKTIETPCWVAPAQVPSRRDANSSLQRNGSLNNAPESLHNGSPRYGPMHYDVGIPLLPTCQLPPLCGMQSPAEYLQQANGPIRCRSPLSQSKKVSLPPSGITYQRQNTQLPQRDTAQHSRFDSLPTNCCQQMRQGSPTLPPAWRDNSTTTNEDGPQQSNFQSPLMYQKLSLRHNRDNDPVRPVDDSPRRETQSLLEDNELPYNGLPPYRDDVTPRREANLRSQKRLPLCQEIQSLASENESLWNRESRCNGKLQPNIPSLRRDTDMQRMKSLPVQEESGPCHNESVRERRRLRSKSRPLRCEADLQHQSESPTRHDTESMPCKDYPDYPLQDNESHYNGRSKSGLQQLRTSLQVHADLQLPNENEFLQYESEPPQSRCSMPRQMKASKRFSKESFGYENPSPHSDYQSLQHEDGSHVTVSSASTIIPLTSLTKQSTSLRRRFLRSPEKKRVTAAYVPTSEDTDSWDRLSARTGAETSGSVESANLEEILDVMEQEKIEKLTQYLHQVSGEADDKNWKIFFGKGGTGPDFDEKTDEDMLADYHTPMSEYDTIPDRNMFPYFNLMSPDYNLTAPVLAAYNRFVPDHNLSVPDYVKDSDIAVRDDVANPDYHSKFPESSKVSNRGDDPNWRSETPGISGWVDMQLEQKIIQKCPKCLWQSGIIGADGGFVSKLLVSTGSSYYE